MLEGNCAIKVINLAYQLELSEVATFSFVVTKNLLSIGDRKMELKSFAYIYSNLTGPVDCSGSDKLNMKHQYDNGSDYFFFFLLGYVEERPW